MVKDAAEAVHCPNKNIIGFLFRAVDVFALWQKLTQKHSYGKSDSRKNLPWV